MLTYGQVSSNKRKISRKSSVVSELDLPVHFTDIFMVEINYLVWILHLFGHILV